MPSLQSLDAAVLWVRDPITRFISVWTSFAAKDPDSVDVASLDLRLHELIRANRSLLSMNNSKHVKYSLAHYANHTCGSTFEALARAPSLGLFVGTTEHTQEDYVKLTKWLRLKHPIPFIHHTGHHYAYAGENLSLKATNFLKRELSEEYACIAALQNMKLLPRGYYHQVFSRQRYSY